MRLIRYCAPFVAALLFFVAAPSSADVIFQFNGVCDMYSNTEPEPEFVPCSTLSDPFVQVTLVLADGYAGSTGCGTGSAPCLLKKVVWTDHAFEDGGEFTRVYDKFGGFGLGSCGNAGVSGFPPAVDFFVECGFFHDEFAFVDPAGRGTGFFDEGVPQHIVVLSGEGAWTLLADEPTTLALVGFALFPLAFARRRNTVNATG